VVLCHRRNILLNMCTSYIHLLPEHLLHPSPCWAPPTSISLLSSSYIHLLAENLLTSISLLSSSYIHLLDEHLLHPSPWWKPSNIHLLDEHLLHPSPCWKPSDIHLLCLAPPRSRGDTPAPRKRSHSGAKGQAPSQRTTWRPFGPG